MKRRIISGIYMITSPFGDIYIGRSKDIEKRWKDYKVLRCKRQPKLYDSLLKYGVDRHKFEILCECDELQLNDLEIYYVDLHKSFNTYFGLNLKAGGNKGVDSDETKKKKSLCQLGEKSHGFGKKLSEDHKRKIGEGNKGEKSYMFGVPKTDEIKRKLSEVRMGKKLPESTVAKMRLRKHPEETLVKMRSVVRTEEFKENLRKPLPETRRLNLLETAPRGLDHHASIMAINTENGIFYDTLTEARKSYGGSQSNFEVKLSGKRKNNTPFIYA